MTKDCLIKQVLDITPLYYGYIHAAKVDHCVLHAKQGGHRGVVHVRVLKSELAQAKQIAKVC